MVTVRHFKSHTPYTVSVCACNKVHVRFCGFGMLHPKALQTVNTCCSQCQLLLRECRGSLVVHALITQGAMLQYQVIKEETGNH